VPVSEKVKALEVHRQHVGGLLDGDPLLRAHQLVVLGAAVAVVAVQDLWGREVLQRAGEGGGLGVGVGWGWLGLGLSARRQLNGGAVQTLSNTL